MNEMQEFINTLNRLAALYPTLPGIAATVAVNFSKERFVQGNWKDVATTPWPPRKPLKGKAAKSAKGRAILVKTARLKRDVQKVYVGSNSAIVGTSRLTVPYAQAHNEGFKGSVSIKAHTRARYKNVKETYTTKAGKQRTRTSRQVDNSNYPIEVRTHKRNMNLPQRRFLGTSVAMDRLIEQALTNAFIKALSGS